MASAVSIVYFLAAGAVHVLLYLVRMINESTAVQYLAYLYIIAHHLQALLSRRFHANQQESPCSTTFDMTLVHVVNSALSCIPSRTTILVVLLLDMDRSHIVYCTAGPVCTAVWRIPVQLLYTDNCTAVHTYNCSNYSNSNLPAWDTTYFMPLPRTTTIVLLILLLQKNLE